MADTTSKKMQDYKESLKTKAEELLLKGFPETIVKLSDLLDGSVTTNKNVMELVEIVKPYIKKLIEDSNLLKMWISFMIPKIEDGNNFSVQKDVWFEVQSVESQAVAFYDQISRYLLSRCRLMSKAAKYPDVDAFRWTVEELDEKECFNLLFIMTEIRNRYYSLHDSVIKNLDKIKNPSPNNAIESLY